jgi:hypothetical protein
MPGTARRQPPRLAWVMEIFLLLWDEVDDWVGACLALLRRLG